MPCICNNQTYTAQRGPQLGLYCSDCGAWQKWIPKPVTEEQARKFVMPFGKYKGEKLASLPDDYLDWLYENGKGKVSKMAQIIYEARP